MLSFIYNGITSQELGIMVNKISHHDILADERIERGSFNRLNGSVFTKAEAYDAYTLDVECTLFQNFSHESILKIKNLFKNRDGDLIISNKPDHILKVRLMSTVNFTKAFSQTGSFLLTFEVHPFSHLKSGQSWITVSNGATVANLGNHESTPLYKVTGSSTCSITVNGKIMKFTNVTMPFYVDTELEDVYGENKQNLNNFMDIESDFLTFQEGNNIISFSGVTRLEIMPRWCEL